MALSEVNRQLVERLFGSSLTFFSETELNRLLDAARSEPDERVKGLVEALERLIKPAPGVKMLPPWAVGIARAALSTFQDKPSE